MRHSLKAIMIATALSVGAAHAAPGFGASSHRLGGGTPKAEKQSKATPAWEIFLALIGFDLAATVEPVASETIDKQHGKSKQCEQSKKTEVARADEKDEAEGGSSKGRSRTGEPVYLAF